MTNEYNAEIIARISNALPINTISIPLPTRPANERLRQRLAFRNERNLHRRTSALSSRPLLTSFAPGSRFKVIDQDEWWSDAWEAISYARVFDPSLPFFQQFQSLSLEVPHCALRTSRVENSHYSNYALNLKDCYLVFGASDLEGCMYSRAITRCRDVVDGLVVDRSELCYEIVACERCYQCTFSGYCSNCTDCTFSWNCRSCSNCFLCVGLEHAEYCVRNVSLGKKGYEDFIKTLDTVTPEFIERFQLELETMRRAVPINSLYSRNSEDCSGDFIIESVRCDSCSDIFRCEDSAYLSWIQNASNAHDCTLAVPDGVQFCYQCCSTTGCKTSMGLFSCWNCSDSFYSMECNNCSNIFGCIGLRNREYCILNKQFTKQSYFAEVERIVSQLHSRGEWGEFFPPSCSWYGYNQTIAQEYFPLSVESAKEAGFLWYEEKSEPQQNRASTLAESDALRICPQSSRAFKPNSRELEFYKKMSLPLPRLHPDERHRNRITRRYLPNIKA